jgi:hypothetical protein
MNLKTDNKSYVNHLGNSLPKTIKERKIRDDLNYIQEEKMKKLENEKQVNEICNEEQLKNLVNEEQVEYDISSSGARCIGQHTLGGLQKYKKYR